MRRVLIAIAVVLVLPTWPGSLLAQGRSGKANPPGKSAQHRIESQRGQPLEQEREQAETPEQRSTRERHEAREQREVQERSEHAASASPGFFDSVRRFFGFGRSQERMSERAKERERATQQDRGPGAEED